MSRSKLLPEGVESTASCRLYTDATDPFAWGLRPEQDYLLTGPLPEDPSAFETINTWCFDGERNIGFNIHTIMQHGEMRAPVTIFLPDGRILRIRTDTPSILTDPKRPHSTHITLECNKPFRDWTFSIRDMPVWVTSKAELDAGAVADKVPNTTVSLTARAVMMAPAYLQRTMLPEAAGAVKGEAGLWLAARLPSGMTPKSFRFDQMYRAEGEVDFEGTTYPFTGFGLRGHVRGVRIMQGMYAHTWLASAFPGGPAFGIQTSPRPGGGFYFTESYIYKNGVIYPNRVFHAPLMSYDPNQGDYVIELACDQLGLTRIVGRDRQLFWWSMPDWGTAQPPRWGIDQMRKRSCGRPPPHTSWTAKPDLE